MDAPAGGLARRLALTVGAFVAAALAFGDEASAEAVRDGGANVIPGSYVVVYADDARGGVRAETSARERALGFARDQLYRHALDGFSASLTRSQVAALRRDPEVDFVSRDRRVELAAAVPLAPGEPVPPTGVRRILAATTTTVREASGVGVAVLDTGIDLVHPDLNAAAGTDCVDPGTAPEDGHGHGTHVAGTIGAQNDGAGVTGVAPDTTVHAVRVLDDAGSGSFASIICGVDWVTANSDSEGIAVANMSLSAVIPIPVAGRTCATTTDPMRVAICNSTAAGVNYVVAAGNSSRRFDFGSAPDVPAAYPEVLTATAVSDSDGAPGAAGGPPGCRPDEFDDREASFSNFALTAASQAHTIAAPGVCITSTWLAGAYKTISGTSMASPHLAAVVALCHDEDGSDGPCAGHTPAEVIPDLRADSEAQTTATPGYGFLHDPAHEPIFQTHYGYLTRTEIAPFQRTLTVTLFGNGSGTVTGPGISCPGDCTGTYADFANVTLTASPAAGSGFDGFSGDCSGPSCSLTMRVDRAATATFSPLPPEPDPPPDTEPPETEITRSPPNRTERNRVTYKFGSSEPGSTFECRRDRKPFRPCASPRRWKVDDGRHRFRVRATDASGNVDPTAARDRFRVVD